MLPFTVTVLPLYIIFRDLGWLDTFKPLIPTVQARNLEDPAYHDSWWP